MSPDRQDRIYIVSQGEINGALSADFYSNKSSFSGLYSTLKEISEINPNRKNEKFLDNDLVPYVGLPETDDGEIKNVVLRPYKEVKGRNIIKKGDILFARIEPSIFNKKYIFVDNLKGYDYAFTSTEFYIIKGNSKVNQRFLYYQLFTDNVYNQFAGKTTGSTGRRRLDRFVFENIQIPLPQLKTQEEIVDKMNSALSEKKNLENKSNEILNSIDDYVLSELGIELEKQEEKMYFSVDFEDVKSGRLDVSYFSSGSNFIDNGKSQFFELKPISEVANFIPGYAFSSKDYTKQGVKLCTIKNIKPYGLDFVDVTFLPEEYLDKYDKYKIKKGDIILAMTGATIGKLTKFEIEDNILLNQRVGIIRARDINQDFLYCFLNTDIFNKQIIRESVGGAQANISENAIMNIKIPVPKKEIQNKIANEVNSRIERANELKKQANEIYENTKNEVEKMILKE